MRLLSQLWMSLGLALVLHGAFVAWLRRNDPLNDEPWGHIAALQGDSWRDSSWSKRVKLVLVAVMHQTALVTMEFMGGGV